jgi:hypothetical protein
MFLGKHSGFDKVHATSAFAGKLPKFLKKPRKCPFYTTQLTLKLPANQQKQLFCLVQSPQNTIIWPVA